MIYIRDFFDRLIQLACFGCLTFIVSCSESDSNLDLVCEDCKNRSVVDSINEGRFRLIQDHFFYIQQLEPANSNYFALCDSSILDSLYTGQHFFANALIHEPCDSNQSTFVQVDLIELRNTTILNSCPAEYKIESSNGDLFSDWVMIGYLIDGDTLHPPCELLWNRNILGLTLNSEVDDKKFIGIGLLNGFNSEIEVYEGYIDVFSTVQTFVGDDSNAITEYEKKWLQLVNYQPGQPNYLYYSIEKNILTLQRDGLKAIFYSE
ncbi:MAG: hypothetical protein RIA69_19105 [Cyclobacteriaceae bacterium]